MIIEPEEYAEKVTTEALKRAREKSIEMDSNADRSLKQQLSGLKDKMLFESEKNEATNLKAKRR